MAKRWHLIVDVEACNNCRACFLAVKDEYTGNDFPGYSAAQPAQGHNWLDIQRHERGSYPLVEAHFVPVMCNHCENAPCIQAARDGAVRRRDDGLVIIDPEKAKGQKQIVEACPYGAISWNEEKQLPQAWTFDAHLLDQGWDKVRAEQCCPTGVFRTLKVDDAEMRRLTETEHLSVLKPELGTRPRVHYKNLYLIETCFVGGTVVHEVDGIEECAADVEVSLQHEGREVGRTRTDTFGEFKVDRLPPNSGPYSLLAKGPRGESRLEFSLGVDSPYLGVLKLR
jgi:Fe-S-cluster-containing dehydrogenase component